MITVLDVYMAVIAGNVACFFAAGLWFKPKSEPRTKKEAFFALVGIGAMIGIPCVLVLMSAANPT